MSFRIALSRAMQVKLLLLATIATGLTASVAGHGTMAYFTTQVTSTNDHFTAGNLHFQIANFNGSSLNGGTQGASGTVSSSITLTDIKPGDTVFAPLSIKDDGSLDSRWGLTYTTSATGSSATDLAGALQIGIVGSGEASGTATTDCVSGASGYGSATKFPEQILALGAMTVGGPASPVVDSSKTAEASFGVFSSGDNGSKSLAIQHGTTDILCLQIYFPNGAPGTPDGNTGDNAWNGSTNGTYGTTLVFTFDGRQLVDPSYPNPEYDETTAAYTGNH